MFIASNRYMVRVTSRFKNFFSRFKITTPVQPILVALDRIEDKATHTVIPPIQANFNKILYASKENTIDTCHNLKWLRHFFRGGRGRFERGYNGARRRVGRCSLYVGCYSLYVGCYVFYVRCYGLYV